MGVTIAGVLIWFGLLSSTSRYVELKKASVWVQFLIEIILTNAVLYYGKFLLLECIKIGQAMTEKLMDVTAHAEMQALTAAANGLGGKYLDECTLYVTLEPCPMCAGAIGWAHIGRLVYGASDPKHGYTEFAPQVLHPKTEVVSGVLQEEATDLLKRFFKERRK
jgi:tRNA(adenine34) deaminase